MAVTENNVEESKISSGNFTGRIYSNTLTSRMSGKAVNLGMRVNVLGTLISAIPKKTPFLKSTE